MRPPPLTSLNSPSFQPIMDPQLTAASDVRLTHVTARLLSAEILTSRSVSRGDRRRRDPEPSPRVGWS